MTTLSMMRSMDRTLTSRLGGRPASTPLHGTLAGIYAVHCGRGAGKPLLKLMLNQLRTGLTILLPAVCCARCAHCALLQSEFSVTLVHSQDRLLAGTFNDDVALYAKKLLTREGVKLQLPARRAQRCRTRAACTVHACGVRLCHSVGRPAVGWHGGCKPARHCHSTAKGWVRDHRL